jgi:hypothetical protein
MSPPTIQKAIDQGILQPLNRYDSLDDVRKDYLVNLRSEKAREGRGGVVGKLREKEVKARVRLQDIKGKQLRGLLVRIADVVPVVTLVFSSLRNALLSFPGRVATEVHMAGTVSEVEEILTREVKSILQPFASIGDEIRNEVNRRTNVAGDDEGSSEDDSEFEG